jgi:hypothetical protein
VQFEKSTGIGRLTQSVPILVDLFDRWSKGEKEMLCRSNDGQLFGFLFRSLKPPAMMRSEFESSGATVNGDSFVLFEVGEEFTGTTGAFVRAWTWLQHH